jgi:glucan phosphorylase
MMIRYEKFSMSYLAANLSQEINGVSLLHGRSAGIYSMISGKDISR